jgi:hypothetical protein
MHTMMLFQKTSTVCQQAASGAGQFNAGNMQVLQAACVKGAV